MSPNNPEQQTQDLLHKLFSTNLFEFRKMNSFAEGQNDNALPVGPGSGGLLKYSDGSIKYDLRAYPEGPGLFGYTHPVIFKSSLEAKLSGRQKASEEEMINLWEQRNKVLKVCDSNEKEILKTSFPSSIFKQEACLKNIEYETYLTSFRLLRLLNEGPILGPRGRVKEIESWLDEYRGALSRKNLTLQFCHEDTTNLFKKGVVYSSDQLYFPLCLLKEQVKEIFQILKVL